MYRVDFIQSGRVAAVAYFATARAAAGHIFTWRALGAGYEVIT